jgi:hypothetical protein
MPSSFRKAKLGRGSGISLSPDAKRLAALLSVDADTVVVVKPGATFPVKEGLDDAEDDATTATQVTDPRPKSSPSVDGANEQEAYGVAVSLLVAGLRPDDLEQRLQSEGWSPEISAKVSRDLGKLGAGLSRHNKPEPPASKPSPDALNAMLIKRQPQIKKPEAPDPLAAYLKMKKFGKISASRGAAVPSRHRRASSPGMMEVAGLFFDFEPVRTVSGPSRRVRGNAVASTPSS